MKKISIILTALLMGGIARAQGDYSKSLDGVKWVKIKSSADFSIHAHNANTLLIKAGAPMEVPERAKGLKLVGEGGTDNTQVGFSVVQDGNTLLVNNLRKSESAAIYLPKSMNISAKTSWSGNIEIEGFTGEIEVDSPLNGQVKIVQVSGPVTASTLNGDLTVDFSTIKQATPISLYSTNGAVDVSLPAQTPASLQLSTINGSVYTDFDLRPKDEDGLSAILGRKIETPINGGGVAISLKSVNGNMYLRKK